jgi:hypothetical protein
MRPDAWIAKPRTELTRKAVENGAEPAWLDDLQRGGYLDPHFRSERFEGLDALEPCGIFSSGTECRYKIKSEQ